MFPKIFLKQFFNDAQICGYKLSDHMVLGFIVAFLDAFMIALISFFYSFFSSRIMRSAMMVFAQRYEQIENITPEAMLEFTSSSLGQDTIFVESVKNGSLFLLSVYISWCIVQALSWHITYRITEAKDGPKLFNYIKRFFIVNLFWILPIYALMVIYFYFSSRTELVQGNFVFLFYAILGVIAVLMHVSYCLIFQKKCLQSYLNDFFKVLQLDNVPKILIIIFSAAVLYYISDLIQAALIHSPGAMLFVGFILVFSIIIMTRLMLLKSVYRISRNKKRKLKK